MLFSLLTILGLAGNYFRYPLFFSIDFLFGSIFSMLVLQMLGVRAGVVAALITSSVTYLLWSHPYAIVIMTCETLAVGWLGTRKDIGLVIADTLYWCFIGIPLVFIFYYGVMHLSVNNASITMFKQAINGIMNVLISRFIFMAVAYRSRQSLFSLQEVAFNLFILFVLAPSLMIMAVQSENEVAETDARIREALSLTGNRTKVTLSKWTKDKLAHILFIAKYAGDHPVSGVQSHLDDMTAQEESFLRAGFINSRGISVAFSPAIDEHGTLNIGKSFADRPYIPVLKETLQPLLGEVVEGRIGTPRPIVSILAPVISNKRYAGYVGAVLRLEAIDEIVALNAKVVTLPGLVYTLLDKNGNVIVSSRRDLNTMDAFKRHEGELSDIGDGTSQWLPAGKSNISVSDRWKNAVYIKESEIGDLPGWRLILEQPIAPFQEKFYSKYRDSLLRLFIFLLALLVLAKIISGRMMRSLEKLRIVSSGLPVKLVSNEEIIWADSHILEVKQLVDNFKEMTGTLEKQFKEVQSTNSKLDGKVEELGHTLEVLRESEERFRAAFEKGAIAMAVTAPDGKMLKVNAAFCEMSGFSEEELIDHRFAEITHPDDLEVNLAGIQRVVSGEAPSFRMEKRYIHKDGSLIWADMSTSLVSNAQGVPLYIVTHIQDITERKHMEEALKKAHDGLELQVIERTSELKIARDRLRNLNAHLNTIREDERTRIARDIHDELGQTLTAMKMELSWVRNKYIDDASIYNKIGSLLDRLNETILSVKRICTELRPSLLDDFGLVAAMQWQGSEFQERTGIKCEVIEEPSGIELGSQMSTVLYRIFQESLTNVSKHAQATKVTAILVKCDKHVTLEVMDDGKGITDEHFSKPQSFGLIGMRERVHAWGGEVEITSTQGGGTTITVMMPLDDNNYIVN